MPLEKNQFKGKKGVTVWVDGPNVPLRMPHIKTHISQTGGGFASRTVMTIKAKAMEQSNGGSVPD